MENALRCANKLNSGECGLSDGSVEGDWRLPNVREMQSLIDYGRFARRCRAATPSPASSRPLLLDEYHLCRRHVVRLVRVPGRRQSERRR